MKKVIFILMMLFLTFSTLENKCFGKSFTEHERSANEWYQSNVESKTSKKSGFLKQLFTPELLAYVLMRCDEHSLKPSVILSQMMVEAKQNGKFALTKKASEANNLLGIKYGKFDSLNVTKYKSLTTEYINGRKVYCVRYFSAFETVYDCIDAYFQIVGRHINPETNTLTSKMFKRYATYPGYRALIHNVAKSNNFYQFDYIVKN